ncbi:uncharacterized protein C2845_PM06G04680 [Panicum miliaceum]|uniref:DUF569 domain-containing protein n=1 Tax=Panicum miliaceum TaxID=4540 RepID=A0A3L6R9R6_PANMI|nr:uncharacterized protein C2845_PM06G04680 [Panicum miliaceum]
MEDRRWWVRRWGETGCGVGGRPLMKPRRAGAPAPRCPGAGSQWGRVVSIPGDDAEAAAEHVEAWKVARAELAIFLNFPRFGPKGRRQETKNGELGHQSAMESFPDGMHLRLRNRATSAYLHADKDGMCVSLRGSWTRELPSTEWVVHRQQREGTTYVLFHSAANGGYLAAKFKRARRGLRNRFVHVRRCEAPEVVDAFTLWEAFRAPGGGDDVILRHGSNSVLVAVSSDWPGVAALDYNDQNPTMVMRWVVAEAIPPRPGPQVPPGPTKAIVRGALIKTPWCCKYCEKATSDGHPLAGEEHSLHDSKTILIDRQEKMLAAFVTGKEPWAGIFQGIQSDFFGYIHLNKPEGARCTACSDLLQTYGQGLFKGPYHFCTLKCFVENRGGAAAVHLAEKILAVNFESKANAFCLPCEIAFDVQEDNGHATHGWINIIADSGHRPPGPHKAPINS